jgi:tetratricopeptide (TPR) repeat protein
MFRFSEVRVAHLLVLLLLIPALCFAQSSSMTRVTSADILVQVMYPDDRSAGDQILVELLNDTEIMVGVTFTNSEGKASFHVTAPGQYTVRVSGTPIQGKTSERLRIEDMDKSRSVFVHVRPRSSEVGSTASKSGPPPVTSAAELRIPSDAKKAFHKGMDAWEHNNLPKAAEQFEKAVSLYPDYDTAFNNLGVMYYQMGQTEKARAAFERSVALNDKNADADRNLARILIHDGNFSRAEDLLKKSLVVEPLNPVSLTLLCVAEIQTGNDDGALMNAHKVHQLPHEGYSVVHYVAGQALEHKGQLQDAAVEYATYLRESPNGAEASQVRNALTRLTTTSQLTPQ